MRIDCFRLGDVQHFNIMKRLSDIAGGKYIYGSDSENLLLLAHEFAESNVAAHGAAYQKGQAGQVLYKIAADLLSDQEMLEGSSEQQDLINRLRGTVSFKKCTICYAESCMVCKSSLNSCIRYCPNCGSAMHLHCASMWSQSQTRNNDGANPNTFRCPHCFYLLKIPPSVQTASKLHDQMKVEQPTTTGCADRTYFAKTQVAAALGDAILVTSCPVCHQIYEDDEQVVVCGNVECGAIYHEFCFSQLEGECCRMCGSKLVQSFQ
jgi:hypothetical protein